MRRDEAAALGRLKRFLNKSPRIIREKIERDEMWSPVVRFLFSVRRLQHQCQETPNQVKPVFHAAILITTFFLAGCEWFGPAERYKSESGRTTFRAADESPATRPEVTPAPQKIPGEGR